MGLCIGLKDKNNVYIGCNSHMFSNVATAKNPNNFKVWNVLNVDNAIMACQGTIRDANVIRVIPDFIDDYDVFKGNIDYKFVLRNIAFRIKDALKDECFYERKDGIFDSLESGFLFAYQDKLYEISNGLTVLEMDDFACLGSGTNEALGSLEATVGEDPYKRIEKALRAASKTDNTMHFPFVILDTQSQKFKIIDK